MKLSVLKFFEIKWFFSNKYLYEGVNVSFVAQGGNGAVYKCSTKDPSSQLNVVAIKSWKFPAIVSRTLVRLLDN